MCVRACVRACDILIFQGALDGDDRLTTIGGMLSQLPVDVMIGKLLIMATVFQVRANIRVSRYLSTSS